MEERAPLTLLLRDLGGAREVVEPSGTDEERFDATRPSPRWSHCWPRRRRSAVVCLSLALLVAALAAWRGLSGRRPSSRLRGLEGFEELELSSHQDLCGKVEHDVEFHTSVPLYWISNVVSEELCCAECDASPDCVAWTYGSEKATKDARRHCYLRGLPEGEEPKRINRTGLVSGVIVDKQVKHGVVSKMLSRQSAPEPKADITDAGLCAGRINVSGYGPVSLIAARWRTPGERAGPVEVPYSNWAVMPHLRGRAYFGDSCSVASTGRYARREYSAMQLLGNRLRYTVDLSKAGCGCNAQLHLVPMRWSPEESKCGDYFCGHGWQHCGVSCTELGIQDANQYAWSTNLHVHDDSAGPAAGYGGGKGWVGRRDWDGSDYGPRGRCIDTSWPFDVEVSFPTWPGGLLKAVEVTLSQSGSPCTLKLVIDKYHYKGRNAMMELTSVLKSGVTPVISYWGSENFAWLDGAGTDGKGPCVEDAPRACPTAVRFYDFAVRSSLAGEARASQGSSVLSSAADVLHTHIEAAADAKKHSELAMLRTAEEEHQRRVLPNASRNELKLARSGGASPGMDHTSGAFMEWEEGDVEWEVISDLLFVRKSTSFSADILSTKNHGQILMGRPRGGWVKLAQEPGYVARMKDGRLLLRQRRVAYEKIVMGNCRDAGMFVIRDSGICAAAGFVLGYFDRSVDTLSSEKRETPEGCFILDGQLFLSVAEVSKGNGVKGRMTPICASMAYPTTTYTTTTMTTSTHTSITTTTVTTTTSTSTTTWGYPSLFCIEVVRVHGYELPLVKAQQSQGASIFACEEYAVFSDGGEPQTVGIAPDGTEIRTTVIPPIREAVGDLSHGATTNSWLNTETFLQVWDLCAKDGRYRNHHWTIKVDPDAVFFPERLRWRMRPHTMPNSKLFVMNCARYNPVALYGSVEIFSKGAVDAYLAGKMRCRNSLPWHGWGEDFFMSHCMDMLGVGRLYDFDLLSDKRCIYHPCSDRSRVVFHDYKDASLSGSWFQCWRESGGK